MIGRQLRKADPTDRRLLPLVGTLPLARRILRCCTQTFPTTSRMAVAQDKYGNDPPCPAGERKVVGGARDQGNRPCFPNYVALQNAPSPGASHRIYGFLSQTLRYAQRLQLLPLLWVRSPATKRLAI